MKPGEPTPQNLGHITADPQLQVISRLSVMNALRGAVSGGARPFRPALQRSASRRSARRFAAMTAPLKLQVGSGANPLPGWVNTDLSWWRGIFLDVGRPWPVPTRSCPTSMPTTSSNTLNSMPVDAF
jgi:hypothetical protein